jgi:prolyl oligopeptidase
VANDRQHGLRYPASRTVDVVREVAGVRTPDPYRWLEDETDEVRLWQRQQAELASAYTRDTPSWEAVRALVQQCYTSNHLGDVPRFAGGAWFREQTPEGADYGAVVVADEPFGEGRVVADLAAYQVGEDLPVLSWLSPSPDGRILAIGVCTDGSEQNTMRLIDVESGRELPGAPTQLLHDGWAGGVAWLPDSSGFYYLALVSSVHDFQKQIFLHRLGEPVPTEPEQIPGLSDPRNYTLVQVSRDGRWAVAVHRWSNPFPIAVRDLTDPSADWRPFLSEVDGTVAGYAIGDRYVAITDVDAPRGRLVAIPLDAEDPNDTDGWVDLIPASGAVLRAVTPVGDHLYVTEFDDTYTRIRVVDATGAPAGEVPLPARGAVGEPYAPFMKLTPSGHPDEFVFAFSTLTRSWAVYRHRPGDEHIELLEAADVELDAEVTDHWATSKDGTRIPYHVIRLATAEATGPAPTLLYAYGGFNVPAMPQYPPAVNAAFVAAGGVHVHAHIRGGAEFGREWWEGGRMKNKQNCYDDLYAVAEELVATGVTTRDQLALTGASNGGLMSGVAATQRPELWRAVVPRVPVLDAIGQTRDPYDRWAAEMEYADLEDPEDVRRWASISPYELVREGTEYPAIYIDSGDTDPRCPPWHGRKLAARLQAAHAGDSPILLHVWENAGHGTATATPVAIEENSEILAFLVKTLGMKV